MDLIAGVVAATLARLTAQQEAADQLARRRLWLWRLHHEQRMTVAEITNQVRDALLAAGLTTDQLQDAGVGYVSVSKIVNGPRPKEP